MIFRWSLWGDKKDSLQLLDYSIRSFCRYFGESNRYVVYTDDVSLVSARVPAYVNVNEYPIGDKRGKFCIESIVTWKKWCPSPRLEVQEHEFFIDSDVFMVNPPREIFNFLEDDAKKFAILDEFKGQVWQHGFMHKRSSQETPFVNAGLFIQKKGYDITDMIHREFDWWLENTDNTNRTHHDEQGALAVAITQNHIDGSLYILPKEKYMLIGENENTHIESMADIVLFHAVYPTHPAFYRFKDELDIILQAKK